MDFTAGLEMAGLFALENIPRFLLAIVVFYIGRWLANLVSQIILKAFGRVKSGNNSLFNFAASCARYAILFFTVLMALSIVGVDTAGFGGIILGLSAAMAFILQGSLTDLASGVMLMIFRPFQVGDDIEIAGVRGRVMHFELANTHLKSSDNIETIIQNSKLWGGTVRNHTGFKTRRLDMVFGVDYNADIDSAIAAIVGAAKSHDLVLSSKQPSLKHPSHKEPWAKVVNLGDSSVDIELRAWCAASDYRALKASLSQPVKAALDAANINIPYPTEVKIKIRKPKSA